ncbi:MAG: NAD(P)-dependent alcohol dehydrogenase [Acidimicrobiia bacterium]
MSKMKAIVQERYGLPDVLELREIDVPEPEDDQLRIEVRASSLNMYDWHMSTGTPYLARMGALRTPASPGADVAGIVDAVGRDVTGFAPGDEVFGLIPSGAFAEFALGRARNIVRKPENVSFGQAAATPLAGLTALEGLRDVGSLDAGQRVLVNGASGGVGTFAVQIAKALGAEVTAVCSTTKVDMARSIGADLVIDYTRDDFVETERGYDLLLDNVGDRPWSETSRVLTAEGTNVTVTGPKHSWLGPFRAMIFRKLVSSLGSQSFKWFVSHPKQEDLEFLAGLLASGDVVPVIENTYPLEKTADAMRYLGEGHVLGKLVITP